MTILPGFPARIEGELLFVPQDNLNTDGIYGKDYTYRDDMTPEQMAAVAMENYDPQFQRLARRGDILIGGYNFGTGSSREQAATALKHRGLRMIIAGSFSQTYKRNAFNNGYICIECPELVDDLKAAFAGAEAQTIRTGWHAVVDFQASRIDVRVVERHGGTQARRHEGDQSRQRERLVGTSDEATKRRSDEVRGSEPRPSGSGRNEPSAISRQPSVGMDAGTKGSNRSGDREGAVGENDEATESRSDAAREGEAPAEPGSAGPPSPAPSQPTSPSRSASAVRGYSFSPLGEVAQELVVKGGFEALIRAQLRAGSER